MSWLNYHLYGNISSEPKQLFRYTPTGQRNLERIERQVAIFYRQHTHRIHGLYIFRFWNDNGLTAPAEDHAEIPDRHYGEFIRLRFRVADTDLSWAMASFREQVIAPLQGTGGDGASGGLMGWRRYDGYEARGDVGARYGDLARDIDPTEEIVEILTAWTKLRFFLLDHPEHHVSHDLMNLYYNTIGLSYPEEIEVLETQQASLRRLVSRTIGL